MYFSCLPVIAAEYSPQIVFNELATIKQASDRLINLNIESMSGEDIDIAYSMTSVIKPIDYQLMAFVDLSSLHGKMISSKDKELIRLKIVDRVKSFDDSCKNTLQSLTVIISNNKNPDLSLKGQALKDSVLNACNVVKNWK